jgi:glucose-6-phosphate isomerase
MATRLSFRSGLFKTLEGDIRQSLLTERVVERIVSKDHTLWKPAPTEIANRLGWLDSPKKMMDRIVEIDEAVDGVRADGYNFVLLLGMGGSSLAPEVFRKVFGVAEGYLNLEVLDTTDPGAILSYAACIDFEKTLFVVSTKSGGTIETLSLMKYFYNLTAEKLGKEKVGKHFLAITDPGSKLEETAKKNGFRHVFLNDPEIGGRYSALSFFGLVPARLLGIDIKRLLERAEADSNDEFSEEKMNGALLGGLLGEMSVRGRDKLTFVFSQRLASLGGWIEQLLAESTGKEGKGILPVIGEPYGTPEFYGADRVFCSVRLQKDVAGEAHLRALAAAGYPVADLTISDNYDLGGHFFFWEIATAVAGWRLAVNPFDQPNVEASKVLARKMIEKYFQERSLPKDVPVVEADGFSVYGKVALNNPDAVLKGFLSQAIPCTYVAFMAYLAPSPWVDDALQRLRGAIVERFSITTTFGYGPRFLHSTGQLHKGDAGHGLFVQFTADDLEEQPVPDEVGSSKSSLTFGVLKKAQALGDLQALTEAGRKIIRIHFHGNPARDIDRLTNALAKKP